MVELFEKARGKRIWQIVFQGLVLDQKADINQFSRLLEVLPISSETWHAELSAALGGTALLDHQADG